MAPQPGSAARDAGFPRLVSATCIHWSRLIGSHPWWAFLGVAAVQGVLVWLFFAKQRADDERRWLDKRVDAYAEFVNRSLRLMRALQRRRDLNSAQEDFDALDSAYGVVLILGSMISSAGLPAYVMRCVRDASVARDSPHELLARFDAEVRDFLTKVKSELGHPILEGHFELF